MAESGADLDDSLFHRAAGRDADALRTLLKQYGPKVRDAMRGRIDARWRSMLDEDDLMQVTYLEAFLHIDQLAARDETAFVGWLIRIAQNALLDAVKGFERQKRPPPDRRVEAPANQSSCVALLALLGVTTTTPSRQAAEQEAGDAIYAVLRTLPEDYATVVRLVDLEGRSVAEVADQMKRSPGAVHMLRARAHARMLQSLGNASAFFSDAP